MDNEYTYKSSYRCEQTSRGYVAHTKYSIYDPKQPDTGVTIICRTYMSSNVRANELATYVAERMEELKPVLRDLASTRGMLERLD